MAHWRVLAEFYVRSNYIYLTPQPLPKTHPDKFGFDMANVKFGLKDNYASTETLIFMYFTYGRSRPFKYSTRDKILPSDWNRDKERIREKRSIPDSIERNIYLNKMESAIKTIYQSLLLANSQITDSILKDALDIELQRKERKIQHNLSSYLDYIVQLKKDTNSKDKYIVTMAANNLRLFSSKKKTEVDFADLTLSFRDQFNAFLEEQGYMQNSISTCFKAICIILTQAQEDGFNPHNHFRSKKFSAKPEKIKKFSFTEEELIMLHRLDLSHKRPIWANVRDMFLIGSFTALRVSDYTKLSVNDIQSNLIYRKTKKTGKAVVIPVHWVITEILEKRNGQMPPFVGRETINVMIKEIARECGFNNKVIVSYTKGGKRVDEIKERWETVKTHDARRSGIRNMLKAGIERSRVMKFSGHTSESSFNVYAIWMKSRMLLSWLIMRFLNNLRSNRNRHQAIKFIFPKQLLPSSCLGIPYMQY